MRCLDLPRDRQHRVRPCPEHRHVARQLRAGDSGTPASDSADQFRTRCVGTSPERRFRRGFAHGYRRAAVGFRPRTVGFRR